MADQETATVYPDSEVEDKAHEDQDANDQETNEEEEGEELSKDLQGELFELVKKFGMEEMPNRRTELVRVREQRFFWRGYQYPMFNSDNGTWIVPQEGGLPQPTNAGADENSRFYYVTNIYTPLGKSLISALVGSAPTTRVTPCDPMSIDDIDAAKEGEKYREYFYYAVDVPQMLKDLGRYFWTDGRVVGWVHPETSSKFGYDKEGKPKTQEVCDLYGVLEAKVPITTDGKKNMHYIQLSKERSVAQMKDKYPDKADKIKAGMAGPASDQFDRLCRLSTLQGADSMYAGDTYGHLVTESHTWMRPWAFTLVKNEENRKALEEKFPLGCRATFCGNEFMTAVEEDMDKCLDVVLPQPGDGQACASLGEFVIPIQKMLNNKRNLAQEGWEKGAPLKFADSKALDEQGLKDQLASPEVTLPIKNPYPGQPLSNLFYKEPPPVAAPDMMQSIKDDMGPVAQMVGGVQPALFGAPMQNAKTAAVYSQARDQALGSLAITYGPLKTFLANVVEMAIGYAEDREDDIVGLIPDAKLGSGNRRVSVKVDKLKAGYCKCKPEVDEQFAESYSSQKSGFQQIIQFMGSNPAMQELLMQPDNQYLFKTMTGIKGFTIPGADSRNKQLREIEELLQGEPQGPDEEDIKKVALHNTIVQAAGQPAPSPKADDMVVSSVPIDAEVDDNKIEYEECKRWLNSDDGQQAKEFNNKGYMNVRAHMLEHQRAMQNGPQNAGPLQDRIPSPQQTMQAAQVQNAVAQHANASQPQPGGGTPSPQGGAATPPMAA